jgi:hypothetical protein
MQAPTARQPGEAAPPKGVQDLDRLHAARVTKFHRRFAPDRASRAWIARGASPVALWGSGGVRQSSRGRRELRNNLSRKGALASASPM